jgi:hypothetical protein
METHLIISSNLQFLCNEEKESLHKDLEEIIWMLTGLIRSLSNKH